MTDMHNRERSAEWEVSTAMRRAGRHGSLVVGVASLATVFGAAVAYLIQRLFGK